MYYPYLLKNGIRNALHKVRNNLDQKQDQDYNRELWEAKPSTRAGGTLPL